MQARALDRDLRRLAEAQHGLVSARQLRAIGGERRAQRRRVAAGQWRWLSPQVLALVGSRPTYHQRCLAAVLDAGPPCVVSGLAAARLWGLPGFNTELVEVSKPGRGSHRCFPLSVVHHPRFLPAHHRTVVGDVPVTTVARSVFDLAGCVHPQRAERALDNALSSQLVSLEVLRRVTIECLARGRKGSALMRRLLNERHAGYIPPASGLEARFLATLVEAGEELPERQVDLGGESWAGRVDFVYWGDRLVLEIDSRRHHTSKLDRESDARRDEALRAAGFRVLRITEDELVHRSELVLQRVRAARRAAA